MSPLYFIAVGVLLVTTPRASSQPINLDVDLGYGIYRGFHNDSTSLNIWKGIRYAAPPVGSLRWQAPRTPEPTGEVITADEFGPSCPQAFPSMSRPTVTFVPGDEDCLFLNVYSPDVVSEDNPLPVFISIHGGGYGLGNGNQDMTDFMAANDNSFIAITIQYRVRYAGGSDFLLISYKHTLTWPSARRIWIPGISRSQGSRRPQRRTSRPEVCLRVGQRARIQIWR